MTNDSNYYAKEYIKYLKADDKRAKSAVEVFERCYSMISLYKTRDIKNLTVKDINDFLNGYAPSTKRYYITSLKDFYKFMESKGEIVDKGIYDMIYHRQELNHIGGITEKELYKVISTLDNARDIVSVLSLWEGFSTDFVDLYEARMENIKGNQITLIGRTITLSDNLLKYIQECSKLSFVARTRTYRTYNIHEGYVFPRNEGVNPDSIRSVYKRTVANQFSKNRSPKEVFNSGFAMRFKLAMVSQKLNYEELKEISSFMKTEEFKTIANQYNYKGDNTFKLWETLAPYF